MTTPPFTKCPTCGAVAMRLPPAGGAFCATCGADKTARAPNLERLLTDLADPLKGLTP